MTNEFRDKAKKTKAKLIEYYKCEWCDTDMDDMCICEVCGKSIYQEDEFYCDGYNHYHEECIEKDEVVAK